MAESCGSSCYSWELWHSCYSWELWPVLWLRVKVVVVWLSKANTKWMHINSSSSLSTDQQPHDWHQIPHPPHTCYMYQHMLHTLHLIDTCYIYWRILISHNTHATSTSTCNTNKPSNIHVVLIASFFNWCKNITAIQSSHRWSPQVCGVTFLAFQLSQYKHHY